MPIVHRSPTWVARLLVCFAFFCLAPTASRSLIRSVGAESIVTLVEPGSDQEKYFEQKVRPLLAAKCWNCHGMSKQESSLRLDSPDAISKGGGSGTKILVAGQPDNSLFVKAIRREGDVVMPPETPLTPDEVALLTDWVKVGAPWPKGATTPTAVSIEDQVREARQNHWAFRSIERPKTPDSPNAAAAAGPLDRYVLAGLDGAQLSFSPPADRFTLLRRVSFDLTGLPPSVDEIQQFGQDERPDAIERMVDRYLASPHYGERWGRHWLDVARYADTKGYAFANERRYPFSYTYRDYVVNAWNEDKRFDQFLLEQLAADLLPTRNDPKTLAGMGFLTTGRKFNNRNDDLDDLIDVVGRGLMGVTVACARCHDHKFDPISVEDYYSLFGVFASSHEPSDLPLIGPPDESKQYLEFQKQLEKLQQELQQFKKEQHANIVASIRDKMPEYLVRAASEKSDDVVTKVGNAISGRGDTRMRVVERWKGLLRIRAKVDDAVFGPWQELMQIPPNDFGTASAAVIEKLKEKKTGTNAGELNSLVRAALLEHPISSREDVAKTYGELFLRTFLEWRKDGGNAEADGRLSPEQKQLLEVVTAANSPTDIPFDNVTEFFNRAERNQQKNLEKKIESFQATSPVAPPRAMVLAENSRPEEPRVLIRGNPGRPGKTVPRQFLLVVAGPDRKPFQQGSGRLEMAQAVVAENNPLTRRVFLNRLWMYHFGEPIVSTPGDFGLRCEQPKQHAALDYLAWSLADRDWSVKSVQRQILLSTTFQQSSHLRPDCVAKDPENRLLWKMNRRRLEFEAYRDSLLAVSGRLDESMGGRPIDVTNAAIRKRTVYAFVDRQDLPGLFRVFDFASPDQSNERRPRTTVPQQALFGMNSPIVIEQAKALAARADIAGISDSAARCTAMYQVVFGRSPSVDELAIARSFVESNAPEGDSSSMSTWEQLAQLLLLTNEFAFVD